MSRNEEKFSRWIVTSLALHGGLALMVLISPSLFPTRGDVMWGSEQGDGSISVRITPGGLSGIPLPSPPVTRPNAAGNESPGLYQPPAPPPQVTPPPPAAAQPETAIPIPSPTAPRTTPPPAPTAEPEAARNAPPRSQPAPSRQPSPPPDPDQPANAVPYGEGGRPDIQYGQFSTGAGSAGYQFGDGAFGARYGAYVQAMQRAVSAQWLRGLINTNVRNAPRVYLSFTIARDGSVSGLQIEQSSGIPALDNSAVRAIRAATLPPLPSDYRGSSVTVSFYFEYVR